MSRDLQDLLVESGHFLITGVTGRRLAFTDEGGGQYGGKSTLAAWWIDNPGQHYDLVVFCNYKMDNITSVVSGFVEVESVDALADAIGRGERRLVLTPRDSDWEAVSRRMRDFIDAFGRRRPDMSKLVVHDEVPELDQDAILTFVRVLGNQANCDSLCISQSAGDVDGSIIGQTALVWVGPIPTRYKHWFQTNDYGAHYDFVKNNHDPYEWTIIAGEEPDAREYMQPVPKEYAQI